MCPSCTVGEVHHKLDFLQTAAQTVSFRLQCKCCIFYVRKCLDLNSWQHTRLQYTVENKISVLPNAFAFTVSQWGIICCSLWENTTPPTITWPPQTSFLPDTGEIFLVSVISGKTCFKQTRVLKRKKIKLLQTKLQKCSVCVIVLQWWNELQTNVRTAGSLFTLSFAKDSRLASNFTSPQHSMTPLLCKNVLIVSRLG